ncbi:MAG: Hsp20/alpha crystallin family protein [Terriglobales bacterium]
MTTLAKWGAAPELDHLNRFFADAVRAVNGGEWTPRADIHETEKALVIEFDLPGVKQEDLDLKTEKGTLTVRGERRPSANPENYRRVERTYGAFTRVFTLPEYVNQEEIEASYNHGVLTLTLPKRAETRPKQIQVHVG